MIKITFLGTSGSCPTKERALSSVCLNYEGANYLFDCPEGTQRQMMKAKASYMKIDSIFLTHFHADHVLGLPGLIATMSSQEREKKLSIFGPKGVKELVGKILDLGLMQKAFEIKAIEARKGKILEEKNFFIEAFPVKHDVSCYGYVFKEKDSVGKFMREKALSLGIPEGPLWRKLQEGKAIQIEGKTIKSEQVLDRQKAKIGKKISFIVDTVYTEQYIESILDSDALIHEATFLEEMKERAKKTFHSTSKQAAVIAQKSKAKSLYLTHISPRHKETEKMEKEAKEIFANTIVATDLMEIELK